VKYLVKDMQGFPWAGPVTFVPECFVSKLEFCAQVEEMITDHTIPLPVSAPIASFAFQLLATLWCSNPTVPSSHSQDKSKQKGTAAEDTRTNTRLKFNIKKSADMSRQRACLLGVATKLSSRPLSLSLEKISLSLSLCISLSLSLSMYEILGKQ
jgi:hypothetical protein